MVDMVDLNVANYDWCIIKTMVIVDICESDDVQITTTHISNWKK